MPDHILPSTAVTHSYTNITPIEVMHVYPIMPSTLAMGSPKHCMCTSGEPKISVLMHTMNCAQADGHCLYRSLEDQLQLALLKHTKEPASSSGESAPLSFQQLREAAAAHIRAHAEEYAPYMSEVGEGCVSLCQCSKVLWIMSSTFQNCNLCILWCF